MDEDLTAADGRRRLDPFVFKAGFLDTLAEGILLIDSSGLITDCNRAGLEILSFSLEDLLDLPIKEAMRNAVHEDGAPFQLRDDPTMIALQSGESFSEVVMGIDVEGHARRWLLVSASPLTSDLMIEGAIASFDDVTDRIQQAHFLRLLLEVNRLVIVASDEVDFLQRLCAAIVEVPGYALASISFASSDSRGEMETLYAAGRTDYLYDGIWSWSGAEAHGRGPTGTALRTGTTQVANDLRTDPGCEPWRARALQFRLGSVVAIPFATGRRKAVLTVFNDHAHAFDQLMTEGLEMIAEEAEFCAAKVRSSKQLESVLDGTITALVRAIEVSDPRRADHHGDVGALGAAIAAQMGLDERLIALIRQSGALHDVGEIAVPPDARTLSEHFDGAASEIRRRHTHIGADILSSAALPWPLAEVALQHHERMDGSGFPAGLRGGEIILPARIVAVADVLESTSQAFDGGRDLTISRALATITDGAGALFDEDVVSACQSVIDGGFTFGSTPT